MPKIDVDAVLAAKAPRIARWVPGFVIRWLKRTIHQDEINYILDEYSALPPQQFIQACFKFWGVTIRSKGSKSSTRRDGISLPRTILSGEWMV